jgi:hypothetical protein
MDPTLWKKPRQVSVESGRLVADLTGAISYPLEEAVKKGRALRLLVDVRNDDDARVFTETWGFMYPRFENGRADTFPLALFYSERRYLIDLSDLNTALRSGNSERIEEALRISAASRDAVSPDFGIDNAFAADLTDAERQLVARGYPAMDVFLKRWTGQLMTPTAYAGRLLAEALHQPRRLQYVRKNRESRLHEVIDPRTLIQALRWTIRSQYRVQHHIICESCGGDGMVRRANARYCSDRCAVRARAQRLRERRD